MPASPRILHFATARSYRGGERQVHWLHEGLLAAGEDSLLVCRKRSALSHAGVGSVRTLAWGGPWDVAGLVQLIRLVRTWSADTLHCHDAHALLHGAVVSNVTGVPLVTTRRVIFRLSTGMVSRWKYRTCTKAVAISSAVQDQLKTMVSPDRIELIHSCVRWDNDLSRDDARRALGLPLDAFVVGTVGYFTKEKNPGLLGEVARELRRSHSGVCVVCIGPPPTCGAGLDTEGLTFTGVVAEAHRYYRAFDAYLSLSRKEGLGTALVDAVVRDIPAVATDAGGTRDIFPEGWDLVREPNREAILGCLAAVVQKRSSVRDRAREAGKRARTLFSGERMVSRTKALYMSIPTRQGRANRIGR